MERSMEEVFGGENDKRWVTPIEELGEKYLDIYGSDIAKAEYNFLDRFEPGMVTKSDYSIGVRFPNLDGQPKIEIKIINPSILQYLRPERP